MRLLNKGTFYCFLSLASCLMKSSLRNPSVKRLLNVQFGKGHLASGSQQCHSENCETELLDNYHFCHNCGNRSSGKMYFMLSYNDLATILIFSTEDDSVFDDDRKLIEHCFHLGYSYEIIVDCFQKATRNRYQFAQS